MRRRAPADPSRHRAYFGASIAFGQAENVLEFSDLMILGMAFPNVMGVIILAPKVKVMMVEYMTKLKAGEFKTYK